MMYRTTLLLGLALALATTSVVDARPRPTRAAKNFEANKKFGIGLELGQPSGLNGKYFLSSDRALDFGLGYVYHYRDRDAVHLYLDYLFHPVSLVSAEAFELPLYIGIGGRFWNYDYYDNRGNQYRGGSAFGVRVPIGISFDFNNTPIDIFIQVAVTFDFLIQYDRSTYFDINPSVGIRYWFD